MSHEIDSSVPPPPARRGRPRKDHNGFDEIISDRQAMRPEMRAGMREDNPRSAAERRAAEILENLGGNVDEGVDEFRTPKAPDGWTYEWKRKTIMGQEDHAYQTALARTGWEPVVASRHPEMMPINAQGAIERKGMVLMERPQIVTDQVKDADYRRARGQIRAKEQQLTQAPQGQFGREHSQAQPKINKSYEPMPVPKD